MKKLLINLNVDILFLSYHTHYYGGLLYLRRKFDTMIIVKSQTNTISPTIATIGMFDGVHCGHQFLIQQVADAASARGVGRSVITFSTHPRQVLQPDYKFSLLNTFDERMQHLAQADVDYAIVLNFTSELAQLTAQQFITMLYNTYNIQGLCIGYDHRFGHNRSEGFEDYYKYGKELGMEIIQAQAYAPDGYYVSSSSIRKALSAGNIKAANKMLGYNYNLKGVVVSGHQLGREIGYPTANIQLSDKHKLIPAHGVYAVRVTLDNHTQYCGVMNIGHRPSIEGDHSLSLEVHLLNYKGNLYDKVIDVELIEYLREEKTFDSLSTLQQAIQQDTAQAQEILQQYY